MKALTEIISDFAGFQYTPVFKKTSSLQSSGASTPSRKNSSEPSNQVRRHSVIITVGVNPIPRIPEKAD